MVKYYPEFFNDVFGPVMQPGSSSHTAGPCRIGYLANQLLGGNGLKEIRIELDKNGSFAGTFGHMNEDLGMLSGACGMLPDDERMFEVKQLLKDSNINYSFIYADFPEGSHPNVVRFILTDINGNSVSLTGNSTGGGMIETVEIIGLKYRYLGDTYLTCVCTEENVTELLNDIDGIIDIGFSSDLYEKSVYYICSEKPIDNFCNSIINKDCRILFRLNPILPIIATKSRKPQLFRSFDEWIAFSKENNISLSEAALIYEQNASGWTKKEIIDYMRKLKSYMQHQTEAVYKNSDNLIDTPYSGYHYTKWQKYETKNDALSGSVISLAVHYAFGVQALIKGVKLVPGPMGTGGGYLYSAVRAVKESYNYSDDAVIEALFVAAGVGAICYTRTNPTGEILGCTGECGVCGAMAAAAITHMAGGTAEQVEAAASMMLQTALGWPCDPIPGGHNQPCMSRVLTAVIMAITFSDVALSGRNAVVPFHEVIDEADVLARQMPSSLKCTSCGGLCETPTGKQCKQEFEKWHKNIK